MVGSCISAACALGLVILGIYVHGATLSGLTPQAWLTVKSFWTMYFQAAGAELVSYSAECNVQR